MQFYEHIPSDSMEKFIKAHLERRTKNEERNGFHNMNFNFQMGNLEMRSDRWTDLKSKTSYFFGALASLLLLLLSNVEVITVREFRDEGSWFYSVLSEAGKIQRSSNSSDRPYSFSKLKTLFFDTESTSSPVVNVQCERIHTYLSMPSLRSFSCKGVTSAWYITPQDLSQIQKLSLQNCDFSDAESLETILSRCTHLMSLRFQYSNDYSHDSPPFNPLIGLISHLQDTLEELSVTEVKSYSRLYDSPRQMPSLTAFTRLRVLEIEANFFENSFPAPYQVGEKKRRYDLTDLPPNLETLKLRHAGVTTTAFLFSSIALLHAVPKLKQIVVHLMLYAVKVRIGNRFWLNYVTEYEKHGIVVKFQVAKVAIGTEDEVVSGPVSEHSSENEEWYEQEDD